MSDKANKAVAPELMRMLATTRNDVSVPNYGTVLRPQDETLLAKGGAKGIRLYDEVKRDGHAGAVLLKRAHKVLARDWIIKPATDAPRDEEAAELVKEMISQIAFDQLCKDLLEANLYGFSGAEIEWEIRQGKVAPRKVETRHQARIAFDADWNVRLLTKANPFDGEEQPDRKWIIHRIGARGSDPYGEGLGRALFWHVLFKREGVNFWAHFLEKYASPTPFARYPIGTPPSEQERLVQHLIALAQRGVLVAPLGTEVSFLEAARSGAATYEEWCRFWDEQTSVAVLGETLSTNVKGQGSRAAAETHDLVSEKIADADADLLSQTLNGTLIKWIVDFNLPGVGYPTLWRPRPQNESDIEAQKAQRADRITKELTNLFDVVSRGYRPAEGVDAALSKIMESDIVADATLQVGPLNKTALLGTTALSPQFAEDHDHGIGALADQVETVTQPIIEQWIARAKKQLAETVANGGSLADFNNQLLHVYDDIDVDPFGQIMGQAYAIGELTGRADVKDETR